MSKLILCIISLIVLVNLGNVAALRILGVFPFNGKSHSLIQQTIMKGLAAKGHQVDVYSHFPFKKPIPNYNHISLVGTLPSFVNNMTWGFATGMTKTIDMEFLVQLLGNAQCDLLGHPVFQKLLKNPPKYDLVVVEVFFANCYFGLGRFLNIPMIGIDTGAFLSTWVNGYVKNPMNLATDVAYMSDDIPPLSFYGRLTNVLLYHYISLISDHYFSTQNEHIKKYFGIDNIHVQELNKDLALILINYNQALYGNRAFAPAVVPVGGVHVEEDEEDLPKVVQTWLDQATSGFVYVTFGSMVRIETLPKKTLDAFYETFKNIAPVRVLMKIAKPEDLPPGLPSNVMTQTWFSQVRVLKHKNIKMFVTHGGLLSMTEAIYHGVPLIGMPLFGDQGFNIKNCANKGTAILLDLDSLTRESFENAIKEVLNNPSYKKNAIELAKRYKDGPMTPMETSIFWIEYVARNGKDALKLPSVDLPWYQSSLVDVYGFILAVILTTVYLFVKILKCLMTCCSSPRPKTKKTKKH